MATQRNLTLLHKSMEHIVRDIQLKIKIYHSMLPLNLYVIM